MSDEPIRWRQGETARHKAIPRQGEMKLRIDINLADLHRIVNLIDTVIYNRWNRDVPIIPGRGTTSEA